VGGYSSDIKEKIQVLGDNENPKKQGSTLV
jgi:hypothetical protein